MLSAVAILTGCLKNNAPGPGPVIEPPRPSLRLQIIDALSGKDLFIGTDARYDISDISLYPMLSAGAATDMPLHFRVDSASASLYSRPGYPFLLLKIKTLPADTITLRSSAKAAEGGEYIDSISLNGRPYASGAGKIFVIKK